MERTHESAMNVKAAAPARSGPRSDSLSLHPVMQLQQLAGNQAVGELLRQSGIRAKLAISQPDDPEEREADQIAHRVMRAHAGAPVPSSCSCSQSGETCEECQHKQPAIARKPDGVSSSHVQHQGVDRALRSPGRPLDTQTRSFFEPRFGRDLSNVRVHTDDAAGAAARSIQALAFTRGSHVAFAPGQFDPHSDKGRTLLAHELAHTIQQQNRPQRSAGEQTVQRQDDGGAPSQPTPQSAADLDQQYQAAVADARKTGDWRDAAEKLNGFNRDDIQARLAKLAPGEITQIHDGAVKNASVGPQSQVALMTAHLTGEQLDQLYQAALADARKTGNWQDAAEKLNGFNYVDIETRLARLGPEEVGYIHQGAVDNPKVGPDSQVAKMTAPGIPPASITPPSQELTPDREQHLIDLIDGKDWKAFFADFRTLSEGDQVQFLKDNFGATAQISNHIDAADEADRDHIRYLIERATAKESTGLYIDSSITTYRWQPKYRVENPNDFSTIIAFGNVFDSEIDINTIGDQQLSEEEAEKQLEEAQPGPGGFLWPASRNQSTLPVLWQVKQDVRKQMETLLFDTVLAAAILVVQYLLNVVFPFVQGAAIRSLAALKRASVVGRWMQGSMVVKRLPTQVIGDAEAFTNARNARNTMVAAWKDLPRAEREAVAVVTGGVNIETGAVAGGYNTGGQCAEEMVVSRLGGDASKVRFSEALRPRTGQQAPVCLGCQTRYIKAQFPEGVIFAGPGVKMPGAGQ